MKKLLTIPLACLYLLVSSGLLVEIHHCMGRLSNTGLAFMATNSEDQCGKCGMDKRSSGNHCCKDEYKQVKISVDQKPVTAFTTPDAPLAVVLPLSIPALMEPVLIQMSDPAYDSNAPPPRTADRQVLYCSFRI